MSKILFKRRYWNSARTYYYTYRRTLEDEGFEMVACYTPEGHYIGSPSTARYLLHFGLTQIQTLTGNNVCSLGWCEAEQKWYGWSHRALYGFGIGSRVRKGDVAYRPATPEALKEDLTTPDEDGWAWQKPQDVTLIEGGVRVRVRPIMVHAVAETPHELDEPLTMEGGEHSEPMIAMYPTEEEYFEIKCGRGEWVARTLEEAREMAEDFASEIA